MTALFHKLILTAMLAIYGFSNIVIAQNYDTLYNNTIISLTKMGLPPQTIISKINTSITAFDVSVNALMDLQANNVNGDVINEMIKRNDQVNVHARKNVNSKNPNEMHRPGLYYFDNSNSDNPVKRVESTVTSTNKSGGFGTAIGQKYTHGLAKNKLKSNLSGANSHLQINSTIPVFYFYFENDANPNADNWFFSTATSPNEFVCVKLKEKKDSREMEVGSENAYGASLGIPDNTKVTFNFEQVAEGIYKVTFKNPLVKGEYCFIYASDGAQRIGSGEHTFQKNNKVFDFGIQISQ